MPIAPVPPARRRAPEVVLVLNGYGNVLEFEWFRMAEEQRMLARGQVDHIGSEQAVLRYERYDGRELTQSLPIADIDTALRMIARLAVTSDLAVIKSFYDILGIGHRVVHGGEKYKSATLVTEEVKASIAGFASLDPLHNSFNLAGIVACEQVFPGISNVAVFDSSFHNSMPPSSYLYAIPYEYYKKYGVRKYGFQGNSHEFAVEATALLLHKPVAELKLIAVNLSLGCSVTAVDGGKVVDTSMGMSPLPGLIMATRCGDLDPAVVLYLVRQNMSVDEIDELLNEKSGLLGLAGIGSGQIEAVIDAANKNNEQASLALWAYVQRIVSYIGAYYALLGGADAVVFTGRIGETNPYIRSRVVSQLGILGCHMDERENHVSGKAKIISDDRSTLKAIVMPADEELMIARQALAVLTSAEGGQP